MRIKKRVWVLGAVAGLLAMQGSLQAQLSVSLETDRDTFLLYEPIVFNVRVQNLTGSPIPLQTHPVNKRPWLSFQIFGSNGEKVSSTGSYSIPPQVLKPGESKLIPVDITPLYKIRTTGQYDIRASVNTAQSKSFMTGSLRFVVGKGEVTVVRDQLVDGVTRTYSLIRFLEHSRSSLYLRVEEVNKNLVYSTTRLGEVAGFTEPELKFDSEGKLHMLHVSTSTLYRYTRLTSEGRVEYQEDRQVAGDIPALVQTNDGGIQFIGGYDVREKPKRRKLSEDQMGL